MTFESRYPKGYIHVNNEDSHCLQDCYICETCYAQIPDDHTTDWPGVPTTGPVYTHYTTLHTAWHERVESQ